MSLFNPTVAPFRPLDLCKMPQKSPHVTDCHAASHGDDTRDDAPGWPKMLQGEILTDFFGGSSGGMPSSTPLRFSVPAIQEAQGMSKCATGTSIFTLLPLLHEHVRARYIYIYIGK